MILRMQSADLGFEFAWDADTRGVFRVSMSGGKHEQIAQDIQSEQGAKIVVAAWCHGYKSREREIGRNPNVKHYHMFAEMGTVGARM